MSRTPSPHLPRLSRDAQRLIALSESLARSGCRLEDIYWENLLGAHISKLLQGKKNKAIESALEHLVAQNLNAYEILVEQAETMSESTRLTVDGVDYDALLFSAPIVAWTRYQLPNGRLSKAVQQATHKQLSAHILAEGAHLALIPDLICFDQMPQSFQETWTWTQRLGLAALAPSTEPFPVKALPDSEGMLADARFVVGAIVVPKGAPLFRWQSDEASGSATREQCFANWAADSTDALGALFTGCNFEHLQPDAYYISNREADRQIRPLALKAAVTWLQTAANLPASDLHAVIAGCGESTIEEYRVGFSTKQSNDVIYGCIWPILSKEEAASEGTDSEQADIPDDIAALLKELGVIDVRRLPGLYAAEFCDDCGAPYFPNPLGEMMHPELPEEIDLNPVHFH
ncbi:DUF2863 family protein [Paralcaligenes sp. KSB-10]|uniref:DUF2863 family protein n=1 Tax=Paralcaligenes sp. KSB-10 TaxID=2901142 RepID=UPI001E46EDD7|nr:DUF2863 family protein [Paralcaligenes sp. KSB-10]UHL66006.1 DUF2863 family protein [Paralcaligenes sp. KSB-10]